jgi:hypothetical protein
MLACGLSGIDVANERRSFQMRSDLFATVLVGVVSFTGAALAQDGSASGVISRVPQADSMNQTSSRIAAPGPAPVLQGNRPTAGMLTQPTGPVRNASGGPSDTPEGGDIRGRTTVRP